jgi:hypothetical protein
VSARLFELNGTVPVGLKVVDVALPKDYATRLFVVVADYGWAETIIADRCYRGHANDIARGLGAYLGIPYALVLEKGDSEEAR